ncbi:MAG TPA: serine/threonine-protein kinase, partial [Myxococcaceae bacterium]|nr:serine/threonine-protein kinase [Myxococcaceae bacterium]
MRLSPGIRVGPYEVVAVLGTGGMAEVYRGRDTRLGRDIALKVVNESLASNPELVRRFEQEARLAGSLNHPNLVAVYDVGEHEGSPFLVTELLQGESLRKRLARGPIPLKTAVDWAGQMARGLAAAHARGVVHRDVKPDNVFVSADGQVKLLDFGIAKLSEVAPVGATRGLMDETETPTGGATRTGAVLGTPGYMSPEQLRGESVDARSDVFSLGAVIYEMLSGKRPFPGSLVESGYAVLHHEPAPLSEGFPPVLVQVVQRCLEKEPSRRFQSASDLAFDLEMLRDPTTAGARGAALPRSRSRTARWIVAGAALLLLLGAGILRFRSSPHPALSRLPTRIEQVTIRWGSVGRGRFMPDGRIALSGAFDGKPEQVFTRAPGMSSLQPVGVAEAELAGVSRTGELAVLLRYTGSSRYAQVGTLARLPNVGGAPREIAEQVEYADWSPSGQLVIVVHGEKERTLESPPGHVLLRWEGSLLSPRFSSRGDLIAFLRISPTSNDEVCVVDLDGNVRVLDKSWPYTNGLAWAPGDNEVWFTAGRGEYQWNVLAATDLAGKSREVYRSLSSVWLQDIAPDGRVLVKTQLDRYDVLYSDFEKRSYSVLSWTRFHRL